LAQNFSKFPCVGRDKQFIDVFCGMAERMNLRKGELPRDRFSNPLVGLHAAPGSGKSFFLDEVAKLDKEMLEKFCTDEAFRKKLEEETGKKEGEEEEAQPQLEPGTGLALREKLSKAIPICVTYNGGSSPDFIDETDPKTGLALRILWSCLCQEEIEWAGFRKKVGIIILRPDDVIHFISGLYENKPVLLCVDELMKSPDPPEVLLAIGECLNQIEDFDAVVTTLHLSPFDNAGSSSGRKIKWAFFTPIEFDDAVKLFKNLTLKFENPKEEIYG